LGFVAHGGCGGEAQFGAIFDESRAYCGFGFGDAGGGFPRFSSSHYNLERGLSACVEIAPPQDAAHLSAAQTRGLVEAGSANGSSHCREAVKLEGRLVRGVDDGLRVVVLPTLPEFGMHPACFCCLVSLGQVLGNTRRSFDTSSATIVSLGLKRWKHANMLQPKL
jgi:hypothetical protein